MHWTAFSFVHNPKIPNFAANISQTDNKGFK